MQKGHVNRTRLVPVLCSNATSLPVTVQSVKKCHRSHGVSCQRSSGTNAFIIRLVSLPSAKVVVFAYKHHQSCTMSQPTPAAAKAKADADRQKELEAINQILDSSRPKNFREGVSSGVSNILAGAVGAAGIAVLAPTLGLAAGLQAGGILGGIVGVTGGAVVGALGAAAFAIGGRFEFFLAPRRRSARVLIDFSFFLSTL